MSEAAGDTPLPGDYGAAALGLPALQTSRVDVWEYYRLRFLPDGYPGKLTPDGVVAHPLYGTYVVADYLAQYRSTRDPAYLSAAATVASAALGRMQTLEGHLTFMYEPGTGLSSLPDRFYSGLTQARWLTSLARLHEQDPARGFGEAAESVLASLSIPTERGGVLRTHGEGYVIEEYAHEIPDYTLNGWTTALLLVDDYLRLTGSDAAHDMVDRNVVALTELLPLYDLPELANSRYRLSGPLQVRLEFADGPLLVTEADVVAPGVGAFPIRSHERAIWRNHVAAGGAVVDGRLRLDGPSAQLNVLLLAATMPARNRLRLAVESPTDQLLRVSLGHGPYVPENAYWAAADYAPFVEVALTTGANEIELEVPWVRAHLVAHPTSWGKKLGGRVYNVYHFIHIDNLRKLHARRPLPVFEFYAERWESYVARWPQIPELASSGFALERYDSTATAGTSRR